MQQRGTVCTLALALVVVTVGLVLAVRRGLSADAVAHGDVEP
jgi:hypothetical protein